MTTHENQWFEIWYQEGSEVIPSYLLIVTPNPENPTQVLVIDPYQKDKILYQDNDYDAARLWLREDEYSLVNGRIFPDDGW